ncbi:hypothetical protein [Gordonia terrae]
MSTNESAAPTDPDDQHDPDGDPEMVTSNASQPDQAEGEDDPDETG